MLKTVRRKFIVLAALSFAAALLVILGIINAANYYDVMATADARIEMLSRSAEPPELPEDGMSEVDPSLPENRNAKKQNAFFGLGGKKLSDEAPFDSRYFTVTVSADGTVTEVNTGRIAVVNSDAAQSLAASLYERGRTRGVTGNFRYRAYTEGEKTVYFFLECSRELSAFYSFLTISGLAAAAGLLVMTLLVLFFSRLAMRPAQESYEKQKRFITDASHELKTPLAVINAANEVTEMETGETQWTRSIHTQTERLANLTEKLVMLSRMDEEGYAPNRAPFCISDAVKETAESFEAIARHKNREYTVNVAPGLRYDGDENAIRQLCGLLIDNAMKYSDEGGQIGVTLQKNGKHLELQVENTTPGIEKGDRSILFERFYRADASRNSATGGYGIGLSVAKAIVTAHKGKITAYSPDGKRILFTALL